MGNSLPDIHVAFCVNDAYVPYLLVTIKSILENRVSKACVIIHIFTDYISDKWKRKLDAFSIQYADTSICIHVVDDTPLKGIEYGRYTVYAWYRILIPEILSTEIHRVLYLDADVVVETDLSDLFAIDMTGKSIAAAVDYDSFVDETFERCGYDKDKLYVCSGVLLMNLDYWRCHNLAGKILKWVSCNGNRVRFPDQDAINHVCQDTKYMLPLRYGITNQLFNADVFMTDAYAQQLLECVNNPAIIHYCWEKPWLKDVAHHPMRENWVRYNEMMSCPVRYTYSTKGWSRIKSVVWNLLHPHSKPGSVSIASLRRKLQENSKGDE